MCVRYGKRNGSQTDLPRLSTPAQDLLRRIYTTQKYATTKGEENKRSWNVRGRKQQESNEVK
jgi:hypothetical protein